VNRHQRAIAILQKIGYRDDLTFSFLSKKENIFFHTQKKLLIKSREEQTGSSPFLGIIIYRYLIHSTE
jgi:hypothetical protein